MKPHKYVRENRSPLAYIPEEDLTPRGFASECCNARVREMHLPTEKEPERREIFCMACGELCKTYKYSRLFCTKHLLWFNRGKCQRCEADRR